MGFWDKVVETGKELKNKTSNLISTGKLESDIATEEALINNLFLKIGKEYYEQFGNDSASPFAAIIGEIDAARERIRDLKRQVELLKGVKRCPGCGAEVSIQAAFCSSCGAKMPTPAAEALTEALAEAAEEADEVL